MLFVINCKDKVGALDVRMANRPDHVEYLNGLGKKLKLAGPYVDDNDQPIGSMVVIEADNRQEIEALANQDPYAKAGLFESVEITPWKWVFNNPESA